jgi:glycolate oxidase FAD binding subunit
LDILAPRDEAEILDALRSAGEGATFDIVSGGTKEAMGRAGTASHRLDVSALSGIISYEPDELILTARAATPVAEITELLNARQQMLAFSPADWGPVFGAAAQAATLAGIAAANACGSRRIKSGAVRDHLIGCRFVNGAGEAIKAGGRVVKNVTGFDIPKLMCGAFGTLGVMTEMTFRLAPSARRVSTVAVRDIGVADGLALLRKAAGLPFEPTGLAYLPPAVAARSAALRATSLAHANGLALIRVEGAEDPLIDKLARLKDIFARQNLSVLDDAITDALFAEIGNGAAFVGMDTDIWRLFVPASAAPAALKEAQADLWYADWAGDVLWLGLPATEETAQRLRRIAKDYGGHAMLMRGSGDARAALAVFEPEAPARAALTRGVKAAFDPGHRLNPGRMYRDL